jgi:chemotaxis response regulator CheB
MPKAAFEIGGVERQLPLEKIGPAILNLCSIENRVRA